MITEQDLQEAIAECQGVKNPTSSTCIKLAAFLTIREHLFGVQSQNQPQNQHEIEDVPRYSFASEAPNTIINHGDSEFAVLVNGKLQADVMPVLNELLETIKVLNPRLYASAIRKLQ